LGHTPDGLTAYDAPPADDGGGGGDGDDDDAKRSFARDRSAATRLIGYRYARFRRRRGSLSSSFVNYVERSGRAASGAFVGKRRGTCNQNIMANNMK